MTTAERRRVLITGASSGIGLEAAKILLARGDELTLLCRNAERAAHARERLSDSVQICVADLADLPSVAEVIAELSQNQEPFDALVLNAGLQYAGHRSPRWSRQGIELTIAVNHLAHQLLVDGLRQHTRAVVITASEVHNPSTGGGRVGQPAGLGTMEGLRQGPGAPMVDGVSPFNADKAYKDSKLCNLLMAAELHRQQPDMPIVAWSPGLVIPRTTDGFFKESRKANPLGQLIFGTLARDLLRLTETPIRAGALLVQLIDDQCGEPGFRYWGNTLQRPGQHQFQQTSTSGEASSESKASELWQLSQTLIKQSLITKTET